MSDLSFEGLSGKLLQPRWSPTRAEATALRDHLAGLLQSDPTQADRLSQVFLRAAVHAGAPAVEAIAHRARAEALVFTGRLKSARAAYEKACALAGTAGDRPLLGQILVGRIGVLLAMGAVGETQPLVDRAKELLAESGDRDYLRRLYINLGSGHYHQERYSAAYASYSEALRLMNEAGQRDHVWASLTLNLGIACAHLSRVKEARERICEALSYGRGNRMDRLTAQATFNLGALEALRGDYRAALRLLGEAEEALSSQNARDLLAASYLEQAQIHLDLSMPLEVRALARRAWAIFSEEDMLLDAQLGKLAEARGLLLQDRPSAAVAVLAQVDAFYHARRIHPRRAHVLLELARARLACGEGADAIQAGAAGLRLARRHGLAGLTVASTCFLATAFLARGETGRAAALLRSTPEGLERLPAGTRLEYWKAKARLASARGRMEEAHRCYRRAARCLEMQRKLIPGTDLRARSFERTGRIYHEQISLLVRAPRVRVDRVLDLMEKARGRAFGELSGGAVGAGHDAILEMRAELSSVRKRLEEAEWKVPRLRGGEIDEMTRRARLLERKITSRLRDLGDSPPGGRGAGSARIAEETAGALAEDEVLLEYFVTGGEVVVAAISREARTLHVLDARPEAVQIAIDHLQLLLNTMAATAGRPLGNPTFDRRHAEVRLAHLYRLLVAPLLERLRGARRLIIVAHDFLHQVPFECLHTGSGYVDDSWQILRCPTAGFLVERRKLPPRPLEPAVVIAGSPRGSRSMEQEARRVAEMWPRGSCRILVGPEAARVIDALSGARTIHISAHGEFRADNPFFSTLDFPGGMLYLADLLDLRSAAGLVVLSACSSGTVFSGPGDALIGVAHAFLACGAGRLVAALWRVHDEATAAWMDRFYASYFETRDPVAALHTAGRALRETWPHPFYWGGFCVLGA